MIAILDQRQHNVVGGQMRDQIKTISKKGERVTLRTNLARGAHTVFEFYADW